MRKRAFEVYLVLFLAVFSVFSMSFVSAGFFSDFWKGLTGFVVGSSNSCTDSDGLDYNNLGNVNYNGEIYYDSCSSDSKRVREVYCDENEVKKTEVHECSSYCWDGACVEEGNRSCKDSDGGVNFNLSGTVYFDDGSGEILTLRDRCYSNGFGLTEYSCDESKNYKVTYSKCEYGCLKGACLPKKEIKSEIVCTDSDGGIKPEVLGNVTFINGSQQQSMTDECYSKARLKEFFCNKLNKSDYKILTCEEGSCLNGTCTLPTENLTLPNNTNISLPNIPPIAPEIKGNCTDSDGGVNFNVSGKVTFINSEGEEETLKDFCHESGRGAYDYSCSESGEAVQNFQPCQNGCLNGACIDITKTSSAKSCKDSDGGINISSAGTVTFTDYINEKEISAKDSCSEDKTKVIEYSCSSDNNIINESFDCPDGCSEGACVKIKESAPQTTSSFSVDPNLNIGKTEDGKTFVEVKQTTSKPTAQKKVVEVGVTSEEVTKAVEKDLRAGEVSKVKLTTKENLVVYDVTSKKQAKLFGFIPVDAELNTKIDAESGKIVEIKKPWWRFFAGGV